MICNLGDPMSLGHPVATLPLFCEWLSSAIHVTYQRVTWRMMESCHKLHRITHGFVDFLLWVPLPSVSEHACIRIRIRIRISIRECIYVCIHMYAYICRCIRICILWMALSEWLSWACLILYHMSHHSVTCDVTPEYVIQIVHVTDLGGKRHGCLTCHTRDMAAS